MIALTDEMGNFSKWKESVVERTASTKKNIDFKQLVYKMPGSTSSDGVKDASEDDTDDELFKPKGEGKKVHLYTPSLSFLSCIIE